MNGISAMGRYNELRDSIVALGVAIDYAREFNDYRTSSALQSVRNYLEIELEDLSKKLAEVKIS